MKEYNDFLGMTKKYLKDYNQFKITVKNLNEEIEAQIAMLNDESVAISHYGGDMRHA